MENFLDYYQLHNSTNDIKEKYNPNPDGKICKFCKEKYPAVTFNTIPHIVPELFGRNSIISNFECDNCNKKFQKYESDLSTMIQHYLALTKTKTKNGIPNFQSSKSRDEFSTTTKILNNTLKLSFGTNYEDFEFNEKNKTLTVKFRTRKFSPFSVYKVFLKMGISLLTEDELNENIHYLDFLNSEEPLDNGMQIWSCYRYMLKTKYHAKPKINLYKAKRTLIDDVEFPEYAILINFANVVFQFFLPISKKNYSEHKAKNKLRIELFPSFSLENIREINYIDMYILELNEKQKVSITDTIVLYYERRETNI
ncbi:HNH endonuclease [Flavobacterium limi]|uniref:HNH endonuclease 5 domain-containing protein n=1 Tax=Flavobacterium limi TaxID=2045105 RepID=A0ABQ1TXZ5_9FLAO|nr:HNH endonuclease [Flavobacterium limi]GGF06406.1 hypothetical protein GCM10011518_14670 [Flavobacterium limi]